MTKDEADMLIGYYEHAPAEVAAMKHEIGVNHPAVRYMEALELSLKYADTDAIALMDTEEEHLWTIAGEQARKLRGESATE